MPRERFLVFGAPLIEEPEIQEVVDCLRSGWLGTGPRVARFEEMFRAFKGTRDSIAVSSCTAALHLSLEALGVGPGDEVILPALTFAATSNAVIHAGGTPVFVDVDPRTMNIDPAAIEAAITGRTRAVIVVHFAGRPCEMDEILAVTTAHGLDVVEDCAHAIEAEYHGRPTGTLGRLGCFSFYVTKNILTGEGGMITCDEPDLGGRLRVLALHGMSRDAWHRFGDEGFVHYDIVDAGYKYNMTDLQAALGIHQLPRIHRYWERRAAIDARYRDALKDLPLTLPLDAAPETRHAHHLFPIQVDVDVAGIGRDAFISRMHRAGIGLGVHYRALHLHRYYRERFGYRPGALPAAEGIGDRTVSLPLSPRMTDRDVDDVIEAARATLASAPAGG